MTDSVRRLAPLFVAAVTLAVLSPVLTYQWVATWDDAVFILGNRHVQTWDWWWMATTQWYGHWMPLTWLSFVANHALFGFDPWSWHAVNLGLHAASTLLFYGLARHLVGSVTGAVFAALLWGIHPLRMESVAWISERKDVVMGVFFVGSALLWVQGRRWWSLAAFIGACLSKSPAVILPAMLVALDWYRFRALPSRERWAHAWRLWPFVSVGVVVSAMAFWSLHTILVSIPWSVVPLGPRLLHMAYSEVWYALQTIWPARLSGLIEYTWAPSWDQPQYPIAVAAVLIAAWLLWVTRHEWPAPTAAALAYTVAVLPQSGLFQNGPQLVANRYSYLAALPLALLAGAGLTRLGARWPAVSHTAAAGVLAALAAVTLINLPMWRDGDAMWRYAADHEPTCTQCQDMAAAADLRHGQIASALRRQEQAILVSATTAYPRWERHWNMAAILMLLPDRRDDAIRALRTYLAAGDAAGRDTEVDRDHMMRARVALGHLEAHRP